jgi:hypothetical protein
MNIRNQFEGAAIVAETHHAPLTAEWLREQRDHVPPVVNALLNFVHLAEKRARGLGWLSEEMADCLAEGRKALSYYFPGIDA